MEIINIVVLFFLEILLISIETEDIMHGSCIMSIVFLTLRKILVNTGLRISGFSCN